MNLYVGLLPSKSFMAPHTNQELIVGVSPDQGSDIQLEGQKAVEVLTGLAAVDDHLRVTRHGLEVQDDPALSPCIWDAECSSQPAHLGIIPVRRITGVINGAWPVWMGCPLAHVAAGAPRIDVPGRGDLDGHASSQRAASGIGSSGATPRSRAGPAAACTGWNCQSPLRQTSCRYGASTGLTHPSAGAKSRSELDRNILSAGGRRRGELAEQRGDHRQGPDLRAHERLLKCGRRLDANDK